MVRLLMCLLATVGCISAAKLPGYIAGCKRSDPNLGQCATNAANAAIPVMVKGDKQYKVPVLEPMHLDLVNMDVGESLNMKFTDLTIGGLSGVKINSMNIDIPGQHWSMKAECPILKMLLTYDIKGRILILPIVGNGPGNITLVNPTFDFTFDFEYSQRKGKQYIVLKNGKMDLAPKRMYYTLENLFNGDKRLGDEMNRFLNENWDEVLKEIGPSLGETIKSITMSVMNSYFHKVPFDQIFPA